MGVAARASRTPMIAPRDWANSSVTSVTESALIRLVRRIDPDRKECFNHALLGHAAWALPSLTAV
jgi:hypothetical protein